MASTFLPTSLNNFTPVVLAGGSGTRFWPRSRRARAKQVLALDGERTMIQQTVDRLLGLATMNQVWVVANDGVAGEIRAQLPTLPETHLLREPAARNTSPACGLAAFLAYREHPDTVLGFFPSDHVITEPERFHAVLRKGMELARKGPHIVALGVEPTHAETGYGYIELDREDNACGIAGARAVHSFTEKPDRATAEHMLRTGRYVWNSGMFLMTARTACDAWYEHAPHIAAPLEAIADTAGTPHFPATFAALYPSCQNISIDYSILEPRSRKGARSGVYCLPASFGWNDLGSWSALHEHRRSCAQGDVNANVVEGSATSIHARGNYVYAPGRHVALLGVQNLVVVLTDDAVLVTTQDRAQEVGTVVRQLSEAGQIQLI